MSFTGFIVILVIFFAFSTFVLEFIIAVSVGLSQKNITMGIMIFIGYNFFTLLLATVGAIILERFIGMKAGGDPPGNLFFPVCIITSIGFFIYNFLLLYVYSKSENDSNKTDVPDSANASPEI